MLLSVGAAQAEEIAFLGYTNGYWQVWVMQMDGDGQRQVTRSPYDKSRVSWFPDGEYLLVNGLQGELMRVSVADGVEAPIELSFQGMSDACLSPDGSQIVFSLVKADKQDETNLWLVKLDGVGQRKLTSMQYLQHDPVWSHDGDWVYFLSGDGGQAHDIWRVSIASGNTEQLTAGHLYHFDVSVAHDGRMAFSSNRSGNYEIWVQAPKQEPKAVTHDPGLDGHPAWSSAGDRLIFESTRGGVPNLWSIGLPDGEPVQLTKFTDGARFPVLRQQVITSSPVTDAEQKDVP
jgi:TolB protein